MGLFNRRKSDEGRAEENTREATRNHEQSDRTPALTERPTEPMRTAPEPQTPAPDPAAPVSQRPQESERPQESAQESERPQESAQESERPQESAPVSERLAESLPAPGAEQRPAPAVEQDPVPAVEERPAPAAVEPAPAQAASPAPVEVDRGESEAGGLEKEDLRRSLKAPGQSVPVAAEDDGEGRRSAEDLIAPTPHRKKHPFQPEVVEEPTERRMKVYAFANQKGGVAKTTTALNLAVALSESGHRVLCVDLDPQGNLTMSQGIDPDEVDKSMYNVLVDRMPIREIVHHAEIDIAVSSIDLAGAEIAMSTQIGRERSLQKALAAIADDYDFVCIDTPPSLGLLTINALTAADKVIVPVQCEYLSMRGLMQLQNTLEMIRENLNPNVRIEGILPTMLDSRTVHAKEAVEILEENFGDLVFKSRIKKTIKFAEAPVKGSSVLKYDPQGNAAKYYRELAEEVLTHGSAS
jgi:chromosome partitioning protein